MEARPPLPAALLPLQQWLETPPAADSAADLRGVFGELTSLGGHLATLVATPATVAERADLSRRLHGRAQSALAQLHTLLPDATRPLQQEWRDAVLLGQITLEALAELHLSLHASLPVPARRLLAVEALTGHLWLSALSAAPAGVGIWRRLHDQYAAALRDDSAATIRPTYLRAQMLAATQPIGLTAVALQLIDAALALCPPPPMPPRPSGQPERDAGLYWIDPNQDIPATALSRRPPPPNERVWWFDGSNAASTLQGLIEALESGQPPQALRLPPQAAGADGLAALRHAARCWQAPVKRRYNRRRQHLRSEMLIGLPAIWQALQTPEQANTATHWMITNESPDGCAVMHIRGTPAPIDVGELVALRQQRPPAADPNQPAAPWIIALVRWTLSENPQHLELGLQRLTPQANPVTVVAPGWRQAALCYTPPLGEQANNGATPMRQLLLDSAVTAPASAALLTRASAPDELPQLLVQDIRLDDCNERTPRVQCWQIAGKAPAGNAD